jgi:hypothetical protein
MGMKRKLFLNHLLAMAAAVVLCLIAVWVNGTPFAAAAIPAAAILLAQLVAAGLAYALIAEDAPAQKREQRSRVTLPQAA